MFKAKKQPNAIIAEQADAIAELKAKLAESATRAEEASARAEHLTGLLEQANAQVEQLESQVAELVAAQHSARKTIEGQQHQLEQFIRRLYGAKSEKYNPNQMLFEQLLLEAEDDAEQAASPENETSASEGEFEGDNKSNDKGDSKGNGDKDTDKEQRTRRKQDRKSHGRVPVPEHLERVIVDVDVPGEDRICLETGEPMVVVGYEESEKLEYRR